MFPSKGHLSLYCFGDSALCLQGGSVRKTRRTDWAKRAQAQGLCKSQRMELAFCKPWD